MSIARRQRGGWGGNEDTAEGRGCREGKGTRLDDVLLLDLDVEEQDLLPLLLRFRPTRVEALGDDAVAHLARRPAKTAKTR